MKCGLILSVSVAPRQSQDQLPGMELHLLPLVGGATESIFPKVEALLNSDADYQNALGFIGRHKSSMTWYRSVVDMLFCEINTEHRQACKRFYLGGGPQLRELVTPGQLGSFSHQMLIALDIAYKRYKEDRWISWMKFREEVLAA